MKNSFGTAVTVTLFGESHGEAVGAVLDGLAPGMPIHEEFITAQLARRRSFPELSTARREPDTVRFISGVFEGKTTGTPLTLLIGNTEAHSADYEPMKTVARPGHADYTGFVKYGGYADYRGGGHFSGRVTAALVAAGAVVLPALEQRGIRVATHLARCAGVADRPFGDFSADAAVLAQKDFGVLSDEAGQEMKRRILAAREEGDSVGGVLESVILGVPAGVGEPWFDTLEGCLSHSLFSIPGVKGVEFGDGFALAELRGSQANDAFRMENGRVTTATDHMGGIFGGISAGTPIRLRMAVKPTPSIYREQETVDFRAGKDTALSLTGRHDPAIVHRCRAVADSCIALTVYDLLTVRYGQRYFGGTVCDTD